MRESILGYRLFHIIPLTYAIDKLSLVGLDFFLKQPWVPRFIGWSNFISVAALFYFLGVFFSGIMDKNIDCLGKIPFTAVVAFVLVLTGAVICAGTLYIAILETGEIFLIHFFSIPWVLYIQVTEVVACVTVALFAILMLAFSVVVSRRTRGRAFDRDGKACLMGGRTTAILLLWCSFILLVFWVLMIIAISVPNLVWIMINNVCNHELAGVYTGPGVRRPGLHESSVPLSPFWEEPGYRPDRRFEVSYRGGHTPLGVPHNPVVAGILQPSIPPGLVKANESIASQFGIGRSEPFYYVFNLTAYGIYVQPWKHPPHINVQETIKTQSRFKIFCSSVKAAGSLYGCGLGGAFITTIGLSLFMTVMASHRTRLRLLKEHADYKQAASLRRSNNNLDVI